MYKSKLRPSEISELFEKVDQHNYETYLYKIYLKNVRSFRDQTITFDFPVTAIIGPNGGGKTTILGAAAIIYADIKPRQFFARSKQFDTNMKEWRIEYELVDKKKDPRNLVKRVASFRQDRWARNSCKRKVEFFGVERTLPAVERKDMLRFASSKEIPLEKLKQISDVVAPHVTRVLGKDVGEYRLIGDSAEKIDLLTGKTHEKIEYSEFHFGAGESSIMKMILRIESINDSSLVIIEEIENGLHPKATMLLVEYLVDVAKRKKLQILFSTHSDYAIAPLPPKAVWAAIDGSVAQGKLSIESLRSITGETESQLVIYVEDEFARIWIQTLISQVKRLDYSSIEVYPMGGDGTAVKTNLYHNQDPARKSYSICFIDGDSRQRENELERVYRLFGQTPETYVFDKVMEKWDAFGAKLTTMLTQRFELTAQTKEIILAAKRSNRDAHMLYDEIAEQLLIPRATAMQAFIAIWCQAYDECANKLYSYIEMNYPKAEA